MESIVEGLIYGTHSVHCNRRIIHPDMWSQVFQYETERLWHGKHANMTLQIQDREPYKKARELNLLVLNERTLRRAASTPALRTGSGQLVLVHDLPQSSKVQPKSIAKLPLKKIVDGSNINLAHAPHIVHLKPTSESNDSDRPPTDNPVLLPCPPLEMRATTTSERTRSDSRTYMSGGTTISKRRVSRRSATPARLGRLSSTFSGRQNK